MPSSFRSQPITPLHASHESASALGGLMRDLNQQIDELLRSVPRFQRGAPSRRINRQRAEAIEEAARRKTELVFKTEMLLLADSFAPQVQQAVLRKIRANSQLHTLANVVFGEMVQALFQIEGKVQENLDDESDIQHDAVDARLAKGRITPAEAERRHAMINERAGRSAAVVSDNSVPMEDAMRQYVRDCLAQAMARM